MKRRKFDVAEVPANVGKGLDDRYKAATPLRGLLNIARDLLGRCTLLLYRGGDG